MNDSDTHRCSGFESSLHYASGKVQTVRPTNHLMGAICTGFVCIATTLRAGQSGTQIPVLAIDFYLLQERQYRLSGPPRQVWEWVALFIRTPLCLVGV